MTTKPMPQTEAEWRAWYEAHPEPAIQSYPPLQEWLNKIDAICDWQKKLGEKGASHTTMVEQWRARGSAPFILMIHSHGNGWDVLTSLHENNVEATTRDCERRIMPSKTTAVDHLVEAKIAIDEASRKIATIKDPRVVDIWKELGRITKRIHEERVNLDTILAEPGMKL